MVPVEPGADAADLVNVGEFRRIKGTDVLIDALAELHRAGRRVTLAIAGDGEEGPALRSQVARLGLTDSVRFLGHVPARQAFALGRLLVVPSRADSLPYVVIEAGGAGIPMIASEVGGIPEIFGPDVRAGPAGRAQAGSRTPLQRPSTIRPARAPPPTGCASACSRRSRRTPWSRACWPATGGD